MSKKDQSRSRSVGQLAPAQKAAVIVGLLGRDAANPVLSGLQMETLRNLARILAVIGEVGEDVISGIVQEFTSELHSPRMSVRGNADEALALLDGALDADSVTLLRKEFAPVPQGSIWERLCSLDAQVLGNYLAAQNPRLAGVVLSQLPAELSAEIIGTLPVEIAGSLVGAVARSASVEPGVIEAIGLELQRNFFSNEAEAGDGKGPVGQISAILELASSTSRDMLLEQLSAIDPELAVQVGRKMFTFADIALRVDKRDIAKVIKAVDQGTLLKALAGAEANAAATKNVILENISSRLAEQFREALAELGAVKLQDSDAAQIEVVVAIRKLRDAGELALLERDSDANP